mmetsp:Transcript_16237/g.24479  ORF Transcript_16237/g.24479 Transcript_16237/m.24479 type:complete len:292 (+) Transcript_16237:111-986(+)
MEHEIRKHRSFALTTKVFAGAANGLAVAIGLHPYDAALYRAWTRNRYFLDSRQWKNPWEGLSETIIGRIYQNALWIPLYDVSLIVTHNYMGPGAYSSWVAGTAAGAVNAVMTQPFTAIKYQKWNSGHTFKQTTSAMWNSGQIHSFLRGSSACIKRDIVFGGVSATAQYKIASLLHHENEHNERHPMCYALGTVVGALASSPFNYERNKAFQAKLGKKAPGSLECLRILVSEMRVAGNGNIMTFRSFHHLAGQMRWGWGTARVGLGMGLGAWVYDKIQRPLDSILEKVSLRA